MSEAPETTSRSTLLGSVVAAGVLLRLVRLLLDPPLHVDGVALNVLETTPRLGALLGYEQLTPAGYLFAVHGLTRLLGESETVLRLLPFLGGTGAVLLLAVVARRHAGGLAAVLGVTLLALGWRALDYTGTEKTYGVDMGVCAALLLAATAAGLDRPRALRWLGVTLAGAAACWLSFPAVFVMGGLVVALLVGGIGQGDVRRVAGATVVAVVAVASASLHRHLHAVPAMNMPSVGVDWGHRIAPWPITGVGDLLWYPRHLAAPWEGVLGGAASRPGGMLLALLGAWGCVVSVRRGDGLGIACAGIVVTTLVGSLVAGYPFAHRHVLFAAPAAALLAGTGGAALLGEATPRAGRRTWLAGGIAASLAVLLAAQDLVGLSLLDRRPDLRRVVHEMAARAAPGDRVLAFPTAVRSVRYYARREPTLLDGRIELLAAPFAHWDDGGMLRAMEQLPLDAPTWVVLVEAEPDDAARIEAAQAVLERRGRADAVVTATRARAVRYVRRER